MGGGYEDIGQISGYGYNLLRVNNFQNVNGSPPFIRIDVDKNGPFLIVNYDHNEITLEDEFDVTGVQLTYTVSGNESWITPSTKLGIGNDGYIITNFFDNYLNLNGAIPTSIVQITDDYAKAFVNRPVFLVIAEKDHIPIDWDVQDMGEIFEATNNQLNTVFHLYKVFNAQGKLFTITNEGPFVVGTGGTLITSYEQFTNTANFYKPPEE